MSTSILIGPFTRHVLLGTTKAHNRVGNLVDVPVIMSVVWTGTRLSISGVEGPRRNGDCYGGCGQIVGDRWDGYTAAPGIDLGRIRDLWERWHLNDMRAGSPAQEASLREMRKVHRATLGTDAPSDWYDRARAWLAARSLLIDNGYQYGTKWNHEDVPTTVLDYFRNLPDGSKHLPDEWKR